MSNLSARSLILATAWVNGQHVYLSTACLHGIQAGPGPEADKHHGYCQGLIGACGEKHPAQCKTCESPCVCWCHEA